LFFSNVNAITGRATEAITTSNVTIQKYLAFEPSTQLDAGIVFEDIVELPTTDDNATHNYDGASNATQYYLNVSDDSNTAVDFCIMANTGLSTSGGDIIGLGNETYSTNVTTSNNETPSIANQVSMNTAYEKAVNSVSPGNLSYWRFYLDVPVAQASGDYNNTVYFKGVTETYGCGS
jgi:hypothetical protein